MERDVNVRWNKEFELYINFVVPLQRDVFRHFSSQRPDNTVVRSLNARLSPLGAVSRCYFNQIKGTSETTRFSHNNEVIDLRLY